MRALFGFVLAATAASAAGPASLPGFAAALSEQPQIAGPADWKPIPHANAWAALARATPDGRQPARWAYAVSLTAQGYGQEALGVLATMRHDDPDLGLVPAWQLAFGVALVRSGRAADALTALDTEALAGNAEACAWRMQASMALGQADRSLREMACGLPAINARDQAARAPFLITGVKATLATGQPAIALTWLKQWPDRDPQANLYRGKAYFALGQIGEGRLRLERVELTGTPEQKIDARLSMIEALTATGSLTAGKALQQLSPILFEWRGGDIERRALRATWQLAVKAGDMRRTLGAGATLFRYFNLGAEATPLLAGLQQQLSKALSPQSGLPIDQAAGLYWDFRDLAPSGAEGDLLVSQLGQRLEAAGLYLRAAELLRYQLTARTTDVAQGPLSAKVASLYILAGHPDAALRTLRETDDTPLPPDMVWQRHRVEAAALQLLGKSSEALAVLQDVPDSGSLRAEIFWKQRDWAGLAAAGGGHLPGPGSLSDVEQAMVLRHAIALAMLHQDKGLAQLRSRYARSFAKLPTASAFAVLTGPGNAIGPAAISRAMATLPSASPAGSFADLIAIRPRST